MFTFAFQVYFPAVTVCNVNRVHCGRLKQLMEEWSSDHASELFGNIGNLNDASNILMGGNNANIDNAISLLGNINDPFSVLGNINNINNVTNVANNNNISNVLGNTNNLNDVASVNNISDILGNTNMNNSADLGNSVNGLGNNNPTSVAANTLGNNDDSNESAPNSNNVNDILGNIANGVGNTVNDLNNFANDIIDNMISNRDALSDLGNMEIDNVNSDNNNEVFGVLDSVENKHNVEHKDISNVTKSLPTDIIQTIDANKIDINSITNNIDEITNNIDGITNSIDKISGLLVSKVLGSITDLTGCSKVDGEGQESALMQERKFLTLYMQLSEVRIS